MLSPLRLTLTPAPTQNGGTADSQPVKTSRPTAVHWIRQWARRRGPLQVAHVRSGRGKKCRRKSKSTERSQRNRKLGAGQIAAKRGCELAGLGNEGNSGDTRFPRIASMKKRVQPDGASRSTARRSPRWPFGRSGTTLLRRLTDATIKGSFQRRAVSALQIQPAIMHSACNSGNAAL